MKLPLRKNLDDLASDSGVPVQVIVRFIEQEWVRPIDLEHHHFDEEDEARITLISTLVNEFEVNDEAVPIILHLVDQLNFFHKRLQDL